MVSLADALRGRNPGNDNAALGAAAQVVDAILGLPAANDSSCPTHSGHSSCCPVRLKSADYNAAVAKFEGQRKPITTPHSCSVVASWQQILGSKAYKLAPILQVFADWKIRG